MAGSIHWLLWGGGICKSLVHSKENSIGFQGNGGKKSDTCKG